MQSNQQQAYDRGTNIFSPDGRLYQVEYAREAVERGSAVVGVRTDDAVVFAANGRRRSPLMDPESVEKIHDVDGRLGVASAGHVADARRLVDYARRYAQRERVRYDEAPDTGTVATAIADFVQESTQSGGTRPFGAALLLGGVADGRPSLYEIDPSGTPSGWDATAIGRRSDEILDELEANYDAPASTDDGVALALDALDAGTDGEFDAAELGLAVADGDGFDALDRERRRDALADAGFSTGS